LISTWGKKKGNNQAALLGLGKENEDITEIKKSYLSPNVSLERFPYTRSQTRL
jgi:hypothetical protein